MDKVSVLPQEGHCVSSKWVSWTWRFSKLASIFKMMTVSLESSNQIVEKSTKLSYISSRLFVPLVADDLVDKCLYFETHSNDATVSCRCSRVNSIELQTDIS